MAAKCKTVSSAVGWAISLENKLKEEKAYLQGDLFNRTIQRLPGVDPRLVTGYTVCLYFAEKVGLWPVNVPTERECWETELISKCTH